jgi:hypothetical protein
VIFFDQTKNTPIGNAVTGILARILEFVLSMLFLFSVGASSFKQILSLVVSKSTSSTDNDNKSNPNYFRRKSAEGLTAGKQDHTTSSEAGVDDDENL